MPKRMRNSHWLSTPYQQQRVANCSCAITAIRLPVWVTVDKGQVLQIVLCKSLSLVKCSRWRVTVPGTRWESHKSYPPGKCFLVSRLIVFGRTGFGFLQRCNSAIPDLIFLGFDPCDSAIPVFVVLGFDCSDFLFATASALTLACFDWLADLDVLTRRKLCKSAAPIVESFCCGFCLCRVLFGRIGRWTLCVASIWLHGWLSGTLTRRTLWDASISSSISEQSSFSCL